MRFDHALRRPSRHAAGPMSDGAGADGTGSIVSLQDWNPSSARSTRLEAVLPLPADAPDALSYEIDDRGRLIAVSEGWDEFAMANGSPELRANRVLGRPFWGFFDDSDGLVTEHRSILERCRAREQSGTFLLRCDAPHERRMLRMTIDPLTDGRFRFTSRTLAVQSLDPDHYDRLARLTQAQRIARCSHCNRFRVRDDWFEPELAILQEYDRPEVARHSGMIHTLCPSCRQTLRCVPRLVAAN